MGTIRRPRREEAESGISIATPIACSSLAPESGDGSERGPPALSGIFLFVVAVPAIAVPVGLSHLGTWLSPPYGLRVLGWGLVTWGLLALLALIFGVFWWQGHQIGRVLNDPGLMNSPIAALMSALGGGCVKTPPFW